MWGEETTLARISDERRRGDDDNLEADDAKLELDSMPLNEGIMAAPLPLASSASLGSSL